MTEVDVQKVAPESVALADGFVRAVLDDNIRLRAELTQARSDALNERNERNKLYGDIHRLVDKLGGDVTVEHDGMFDARRLYSEGDYDYNNSRRYRLIDTSEPQPVGATPLPTPHLRVNS